MSRPFTTNDPLEKAILITAITNYKTMFTEHLKTSKNDGFMSDNMIQLTIKSIEAKLDITIED